MHTSTLNDALGRGRPMRWIGFALGILIAGCGSSNGTTPMTTSSCDESGIAACFAVQKACALASGRPACNACSSGKYANRAGVCEAIGGPTVEHDFPLSTTMPGQEVLGMCRSWTLNNATELWVNAVELDQDEASHHSNWTFAPDDKYTGPDGIWPCQDRHWDQLTSALAGGVIYAQSTQAAHEVQKFPNGAAVRIPPYSRIFSDMHLLNATSAPISGRAKLTLHTLPLSEVKIKLVPFHLTYHDLKIPPRVASRFTGSCNIAAAYQAAAGTGFTSKIYYILPHTHKMASRFFVNMVGGPKDGTTLIEIGAYNGEAHGRAFDPPIVTDGASGLSFGCEYHSDRDQVVRWGFGDQEMCELLGFADSALAFEGSVQRTSEAGNDGNIQLFTGPCDPLAFSWDHRKPGGPGPN